MEERNHAYKEYQISICKNYDPNKDKYYNNSKVAYGWYPTTLKWTEPAVRRFTTQEAISNIFSDGHKVNDSWVKTTYIMLDSDDGEITADELIDQQSEWQFDSYIYSSQNHQKKKRDKTCDRLRVLIPLKAPIDVLADLNAVKEYFIEKFPWTDKSFMDQARYFAHGTDVVSSFVGDKGPLDWRSIPGLGKYCSSVKTVSKTTWKKPTTDEIKISDFIYDEFRNKKRVIDVKPGESIFCPFCYMSDERNGDQHNAAIVINDNGLPILTCQSCKSRGHGNKGVYNFDEVDALIYRYNLEDIIVFIDNLDPKYYGGCYDENPKKFVITDLKSKEHAIQFCKYHKLPVPDVYPRADYKLLFKSDKLYDFEAGYVNKYSPSELIKSQAPNGYTAKLPNYIERLIDHILAHDKEIIERFYNDIAWWIQNRKKLTTTYLMQGVEGTGKGIFFDNVIKPIIGSQYCSQTTQDAFGNQFNSYLEDNLALLVNEVSGNFSSSESGNFSTFERMKTAITDLNVQIEGKNNNRYNGKNNCTLFFTSNRRHALTLADDDRRFNVAPRQEVKIINTSWWPGYPELIELIKSELQEFVWYLKQYTVDESLIGRVIDNEPKRLLQNMSKTNADMFFDAVKAGDLQWMYDNVTRDRDFNKKIKIKNILLSLNGSDKCKTEDLCLLYNNINGKNLTPVAFGRMASGYIGQASQIRFDAGSKKGFNINWSSVDPADVEIW